ncbi:MAG TPA: P-loop NTPase [Candidatus Thermoplasmatota archaeon]|nr:P-loop NTPase [Candidatus Thermoplasmatota archaeon]
MPFLGRVPFDPRIVRQGDAGKPFVLEHLDSEAGKAFASIVAHLAQQLQAKPA